MEDDQVMDSSRADAALAMFSEESQEPDGDAQPGGEPQPASGEQPAAGSEPQAQQLSDEQLQGDPRYQELATLKDSLLNEFSNFPGLVDDKGNVNIQEAGLQLKDASILYDIMAGRGTPSALLELMASNAGWSNEQKQAVAQDLIGWLTKGGYLKDGAAQPGKDGKPANFKDPLAERIDKLETDRRTEAQRAEQQRVQAHQEKVYRENFLPEVERLCKQKGVPKEDVMLYVNAIAQGIRGNKAMLGRIEKANYVDIQRLFAGVYNKEAERLKRWTAAQTKAADAKNKNPKIPAGGAPPRPAGSAKPLNARNRDERIAAASELL